MRVHSIFHGLLIFAILALAPGVGHALPPGLVTKRSTRDVAQTLDRLQDLLKQNGFTIVDRIDQQAIAKQGGETIAPAELLIVSLPSFDAPLLKGERAIGLDLPIRFLAWEDSSGRVSLVYPDPDRLAQRYGVGNAPVAVQHMTQLLDRLTDQAVKP